jgi:SAM-dependent methyltransferase
MSMPNEQSDIWDDIFENDNLNNIETLLEGNRWYSVSHSPYLSEVLNRVPKDATVHESGCGLGQWLIYLHRIGYENLYGIDFAQKTIQRVQKLYPFIHFKYGNIKKTDYDDDTFDALLTWSVVDHLGRTDLSDTLDDYRRILKKEGLIFIAVPYKNWLYYSPWLKLVKIVFNNRKFRKLIGLKEIKGQFIQYFFSRKELISLLKKRKFEIVKEMYNGHEVGLTRHLNGHFMNKTKIFHKNKSGEWNGLNKSGQFFCKLLKLLSKKATADEILIIAVKK